MCRGGDELVPQGFRLRRGGRGLPLFLPLRRGSFPRRVQRGGVWYARRLVFFLFFRRGVVDGGGGV